MKIERWTIWLANLDPVIGSEQGNTRPVLVISETAINEILPVVNVLPITSRKPGRKIYSNEALLPTSTPGLTAESLVLAYQIRTLDKKRLQKMFATITDPLLQEAILEAVTFQLGINK